MTLVCTKFLMLAPVCNWVWQPCISSLLASSWTAVGCNVLTKTWVCKADIICFLSFIFTSTHCVSASISCLCRLTASFSFCPNAHTFVDELSVLHTNTLQRLLLSWNGRLLCFFSKREICRKSYKRQTGATSITPTVSSPARKWLFQMCTHARTSYFSLCPTYVNWSFSFSYLHTPRGTNCVNIRANGRACSDGSV